MTYSARVGGQVKMDWCGDNKTLDAQGRAEGHLNFSKALNATGRPMAFELCRGPYEKMDHWVRTAFPVLASPHCHAATSMLEAFLFCHVQGYADQAAQLWRADGDHHDSFSHTLEQLAAIKGKNTWSGPHGWAYSKHHSTIRLARALSIPSIEPCASASNLTVRAAVAQ
jgi:alpha-galactosidase